MEDDSHSTVNRLNGSGSRSTEGVRVHRRTHYFDPEVTLSLPYSIMQEFLEVPDLETQDKSTSMAELTERIAVIESTVNEIRELLANPTPQREWYTVSEVAQLLGKAEFTVREWARLGRVYASKRECGRGQSQEWIISTEEVERIRNEGLLPN